MLQQCKTNVREEVLSKVESKIFIKRMLAIGISNIVYIRNVFPESAFSDRKFEGLALKILKEQGHEGANQVVNWMKGVYDALEHEYLRVLIFAFMQDSENTESVIETYSFGFTYHDGSVQATVKVGNEDSQSASLPTKQNTKESAKQMLRHLIVLTNSLDDLPENAVMTVRLLYYDQTTPKDYQPPGFVEAAEKDSLQFTIDNVRIKVGSILTPYATVKLRARAGRSHIRNGEMEMNEVNEDAKQMSTSLDDSQYDCNLSQATSVYKDLNSTRKDAKATTEDIKHQESGSSSGAEINGESGSTVSSLGVRCPCGDCDDDGTMILCSRCNYWQHAICFCVPDNAKTPEQHSCHICSEKVNVLCTDPRLPGLDKHRQQELCLWRRTLLTCFDQQTITVTEVCNVMNCTRSMAQKIVTRMMEEKIVHLETGQRQRKTIDHEKLQQVFEREIKHVAKNLARQRGEATTSQESNVKEPLSSVENFKRKPDEKAATETEITSKTAKLGINKASGVAGNKRKMSTRTRFSPPRSQASADAFQDTMETKVKKAKMSKSSVVNRRK